MGGGCFHYYRDGVGGDVSITIGMGWGGCFHYYRDGVGGGDVSITIGMGWGGGMFPLL